MIEFELLTKDSAVFISSNKTKAFCPTLLLISSIALLINPTKASKATGLRLSTTSSIVLITKGAKLFGDPVCGVD
jgi:hypothetical protein